MSSSRSETEPRYSLEHAEARKGSKSSPDKWSARRSLLFLTASASVLWAGIVYVVSLFL
jgi:hypothetical protein